MSVNGRLFRRLYSDIDTSNGYNKNIIYLYFSLRALFDPYYLSDIICSILIAPCYLSHTSCPILFVTHCLSHFICHKIFVKYY